MEHLNANELPIIGPSADERKPKVTLENAQLADGSPLYHALLANPNTIVLSNTEAQEAHERLSEIFKISPESVLSCNGKSLAEAKATLESIESSQALQAL